MKLSIQDVTRSQLSKFLPSIFNKLTDNEFLAFFYWYDDVESKITDIKHIQIVPRILMSIHKNAPVHSSGIMYSFGYFQQPFDTQSSLFYQLCRYYAEQLEGEENVKQAKKELLDFFLEAKKQDLENIDYRLKKTEYNNVFKIYSRDNLEIALKRFVMANNTVIDPVLMVCDTLDTHLKATQRKSFYGDLLTKIVMAVRNPNGGLIPETPNKLRYLYVGEKSTLLANDTLLEEAKQMLRNKFSPNEIYAKTNWFFNKYDLKWRKPISDEQTSVPNIPFDTMFMKSQSKFVGREEEIYGYINNGDTDKFYSLIDEGWDVYLSDVLEHPTLYKHYPKLFNLPIFYAKTSRGNNGKKGDYSFYYNPEKNFIVIFGNPQYFDLKTTLLHETQHAIQNIENFGTGGNTFIAKMIQALGGENIKSYFFIRQNVKNVFVANATIEGRYSASKYNELYRFCSVNVKEILRKAEGDTIYYSSIKEVIDGLVNAYIQPIPEGSRHAISTFLGKEICDQLDVLSDYVKKAVTVSNRLIGQGYTDSQVGKIFFDTYEALAGEIEARDVQHSSKIEEGLRDYIAPLSSESIDEQKVTIVFDDLLFGEDVPKNKIKGAVEQTDDKKYVIHLFESYSAEPTLHEIGHIVCDMIGKEYVELTVANSFDNDTVESYGGLQEVFCELFLCYLVRQKLSEDLNDDISEGRKLLDNTLFDEKFNEIFYAKEDRKLDEEFMSRILFMTKLDEITIQEIPVEIKEEQVMEADK